MNLEIHNFKETLIQLINASPLPIEVKRMALSEIVVAVNDASKKVLAEEMKAYKEEQEKLQKEQKESDGE